MRTVDAPARVGSFLAALWLVLALAAHPAPAAAQASAQVALSGDLKTALSLTPADLRAFPPEQQLSFSQSRGTPGNESRSTVRGVRLSAAIERAGLQGGARNDWKTLVVVATATDGYCAVFAWAELTNTPVGDGVILVYERDGQPLDAREGQIALLSTGDKRLGARHVRNVAKIEVRALRE